MRIAVTGASGVIGRGVVLRLLSAGHDVVGLALDRPESWPSEATFVQGDIRDAATVQQALAGAEVVVHCAWAVNPSSGQPADREVNLGGTGNVVDAVQQVNPWAVDVSGGVEIEKGIKGAALITDFIRGVQVGDR